MPALRRTGPSIILVFTLWLIASATAFAQGTASGPRVVLKGYDPVGYFTEGRPMKGLAQFNYDFDGERYLFSSAANRDRFAAHPERYAPQFAGYCTGSMSRGVRNEADPEAWIIADGRLYVFGQVKFMHQAKQDPRWLTERIALAGENWRGKK
ncbi:MAG TPA: YHS domain-containing (seleno)protein [Casimicrobiaceae bacterium]|nr:YHS domain-containing (seleno)protein [Casimicrobiaceae bacterium]